jgi:hypothetical protein
MARCPNCNSVIPQMECENCPEIVQVLCLGCKRLVNIENEYYMRKKNE